MLTSRFRANRTPRLLGALVAALAVAAFVGAGLCAAKDTPPVPSDAEIQAAATEFMNSDRSCGGMQRSFNRSAFYSDTAHLTCSMETSVTKWHQASVIPGDPPTNVFAWGMKVTMGPYLPNNFYQYRWFVAMCSIDETPFCGEGTSTTMGSLKAWWEAYDMATFHAYPNVPGLSGPPWVPGWDLTPASETASPTHAGASPEATPEPELPVCLATIYVPSGLKAGDTLSPSADVASEDGKPIQGTISEVWTIGGVQANSVTWDGKPAHIVLQLSCQGHAQEFSANFDGAMGSTTAGGVSPVPAPGGNTEGTQSNGETPGLDGVGEVPGPADETQGVVGMVGPAVVGILGGLLAGALGGGGAGGGTTAPVAPDKTGGEDGEGEDGEDGEGEDGPDGEGPVGAGTDGKGVGGKEGTPPGGKGAGGKDAGGAIPPAPGAVSPETQAAKDRLGLMANWAVGKDNKAFAAAINDAKANAFDADGNVIPEKYAAAVKAIREAIGKNGDPNDVYGLANNPYGSDKLFNNSLNQAVNKALVDRAERAVTAIGKGVSDAASSVGKGLEGLANAARHPLYFLQGVDTASRNTAPVESAAFDAAVKDGRYLDALGAGAGVYMKVNQAMGATAGKMGWAMAKDMLAVDEIKTMFDPKASAEDRFAAFQAAQVKAAMLLLPGVAEVRGAGAALGAARAAEGLRAVEAARAAEVASGVRTATGAAKAAEAVDAASGARVATSVSKIEREVAAALGDKPAPSTFVEGKRVVNENAGVQKAIDETIRDHGATDAVRAARQTETMGAVEHNLYTARRIDLQNQAANEAGKAIAQEETAGWIKAHLTEITDPTTGVVDYTKVPRRVPTTRITEGDRVFSGANAGSDLDVTYNTSHVTTARANELVADATRKLAGADGKSLGMTQDSIAVNAYTARPGTLVDTTARDVNQAAWLRNNSGKYTSTGGYHPVHVSKDGVITVGDHVGGARPDALPVADQHAAPYRLTEAENDASAADHIAKLDETVGADNISNAIKDAARANKNGVPFDGPKDVLMRAAMAKGDPAAQLRILKEAGIGSAAELRARMRT